MLERAYEVASQVETAAFLRTWTRDLKAIDPYLEMVKAREDSTLPELKPGYYAVVRHNPGTQPWVHVIEGPNGEFKEPDSSVFDELQRLDAWSDRAARERRRLQERLTQARESRRAHERSERLEEAMDRLHAQEPGVSFANQGKGWSYRAGKRAA
jgi:hypothetical protein